MRRLSILPVFKGLLLLARFAVALVLLSAPHWSGTRAYAQQSPLCQTVAQCRAVRAEADHRLAVLERRTAQNFSDIARLSDPACPRHRAFDPTPCPMTYRQAQSFCERRRQRLATPYEMLASINPSGIFPEGVHPNFLSFSASGTPDWYSLSTPTGYRLFDLERSYQHHPTQILQRGMTAPFFYNPLGWNRQEFERRHEARRALIREEQQPFPSFNPTLPPLLMPVRALYGLTSTALQLCLAPQPQTNSSAFPGYDANYWVESQLDTLHTSNGDEPQEILTLISACSGGIREIPQNAEASSATGLVSCVPQ